MWTAENEGAKFWLQVVTELKNRGLKEIFIACIDGLKGFPEAIESVTGNFNNNVNTFTILKPLAENNLSADTWRVWDY